MKFLLVSVFYANGLSKENKTQFEMYRAGVLSPLEDVNSPNFNRKGSGMVVMEVPVAKSFMSELQAFFNYEFAQKRFPVVVYLETTIVPRGRNNETVIASFSDDFMKKHDFFKAAT